MSTKEPGGGAMRAITISRQYSSGGGEIGARLATRLNWRLIDHELVAQVAQQLGITERVAQERDEYTEGFIARLFGRMPLNPLTPAGTYTTGLSASQLTDEQRYQETLRQYAILFLGVNHGCGLRSLQPG